MKQILPCLYLLLKLATPASSTTPDSLPDIRQVDDAIAAFMLKHKVPGLSVAITKNGKLVYTKGYGVSDSATMLAVKPSSMFRIASVSKPITAIAILKLRNEGKLSLDDRVFGEKGLLKTRFGQKPYSDTLTSVTVRHLLNHTSGGWKNDEYDPMFTNPRLPDTALISWAIDHRAQTHLPGENYAYSNFGYCLLGRVIEAVTGERYEDYVRKNILHPAGINGMLIGGNTEQERRAGEVIYYGQRDEEPYAYNITRMDAHGGWLASAVDLARLLVCVDGYPDKPDMLDQGSLKEMTTPSPANPNYALGWVVNSADNWWHNGSLPGTATEIVRTSQGFNWAILTNTRSWDQDFMRDLDVVVWKAINDESTEWPETDLFNQQFAEPLP